MYRLNLPASLSFSFSDCGIEQTFVRFGMISRPIKDKPAFVDIFCRELVIVAASYCFDCKMWLID